MIDPIEAVIWLIVFIFSASLHEAAHAWAAMRGGDLTAYHGGQVSIDPMPHIRREPFGMVALPVISLLLMGWPLGYASAPYDPYWAARHPRRAALMALAGPMANLALMILAVVLIKLGTSMELFQSPAAINASTVTEAVSSDGFWRGPAMFLSMLFTMNLLLCLFNLMPFPPLDGSGVLQGFLNDQARDRFREMTMNPMFSIIGLIIAWQIFGKLFSPVFLFMVNLIHPEANYAYR